jgi:hypothetical protein
MKLSLYSLLVFLAVPSFSGTSTAQAQIQPMDPEMADPTMPDPSGRPQRRPRRPDERFKARGMMPDDFGPGVPPHLRHRREMENRPGFVQADGPDYYRQYMDARRRPGDRAEEM